MLECYEYNLVFCVIVLYFFLIVVVNKLKNDVPYNIGLVQEQEQEETRYQTDSNQSIPSEENSIHDQDEATLLSKELDPFNPKSILAHAKSYYCKGEYNETIDTLEYLNHVEAIDKMQRAKLFGLGICHYKNHNYPPAMRYLDELERVALDHSAAADVAVSFIYRGEIHLAQGKYQTAYDMFTRARTAYGADHVAHLFGIVILSKTSVIIKAANCQKHLKNISKAKELLHTAVDLAVRSRESVESSSISLYRKHVDTLRALYKDEIAARTSLGDLHQNTSDFYQSLEEYRIALKLQEKLDANCVGCGVIQSSLGCALVKQGKVGASSELGRMEPPVGEELEDPSPLPVQPKPHNFQIASSSVEGSLEKLNFASYEHEAHAEGTSLHSLKRKVSLSPMSVVHVNNDAFIYLL